MSDLLTAVRICDCCGCPGGDPLSGNHLDAAECVRALVARVEQAEVEANAVRELMNLYNLGGWTDAIGPMKRALEAESRATTAEQRITVLEALLREIARADHHRAGDYGMLEDVRLRGATWLKIQEALEDDHRRTRTD